MGFSERAMCCRVLVPAVCITDPAQLLSIEFHGAVELVGTAVLPRF
jgi:hypothetical protein